MLVFSGLGTRMGNEVLDGGGGGCAQEVGGWGLA